MRRRLWWSLILFDTRICEIANLKTMTLDPTWDCKIPLNVSDSDLRPEMKEPPPVQGNSTEAIFAVVRCELGDYIRHTAFHLDFTSPALKPLARHLQNGSTPEGGELIKLTEMIEDQYLKSCDPDNPVHFMTIWTTQAYLAKCRLLEHHSQYSNSSARRKEARNDAATSHALRMLECDTKIMTSPLTKGFLWLNQVHFPFPAYIQIAQDLRRRPITEQAGRAWEVMSDNYEAWFDSQFKDDSPFFQIFAKIVLQAWEACEVAAAAAAAAASSPEQSSQEEAGTTVTPPPPRIVSSVRHILAQRPPPLLAPNAAAAAATADNSDPPNFISDMAIDEFPMPMPMGFDNQSLPYNMGMQNGFAGGMGTGTGTDMYSGIPAAQASFQAQVNQMDWAALNSGRPGWGLR